MDNKRKAVAGDERPRQSQRREPEEETVDGSTATAGGNGSLQELPRVTAATTPAVGLQFGGALGRGGVSGTGHGEFATAMLQPPVGNSALSQWRPPTTMSGTGLGGSSQSTPMVQPPVSNPAGGIPPYGVPARIGYGQNLIADPMAGFGRGGGTGFGHFVFGPAGFPLLHSVPMATLGSPAFHAGEPSTPAASLVGECTICKTPTTGLWTATTVQGIPVGTPLPLCDLCHSKIFTCDRPLRHLHQHLASTAVGRGAGSIPAFHASIRRYGGDKALLRFSAAVRFSLSITLLQHQLSDDPAGGRAAFGVDVPSGDGYFSSGQNHIVSSDGLAPAPSPSTLSALWNCIQLCVVCNCPMDTFWDWLPMCKFCYITASSNRDRYRARIAGNASARAPWTLAHAQAMIQVQKDLQAQSRAQAQVNLGLRLGQPASAAQGQQASSSSSSQPAAANAHLHGSDQMCPLCNRGG